MDDDLVTPDELAAEIGVHRVTLYDWLRRGKVRRYVKKVGDRRVYVKRSDVERLRSQVVLKAALAEVEKTASASVGRVVQARHRAVREQMAAEQAARKRRKSGGC